MRNQLLPCLAALVLATSPFTTPIAEACGGYEQFRAAPQVMLVTTHRTSEKAADGSQRLGSRSFAVRSAGLEGLDPASFHRLSTTSYDPTAVRRLAKLDSPMTFTLVGPSGSRIVQSEQHVAIKNAFWNLSTFDAVELPLAAREHFNIALVGAYHDTTWHEASYTYAKAQQVGDTTMTWSWSRSHAENEYRFTLRDGTRNLGTHAGTLVGVVDADGVRYMVAKLRDGTAYAREVRI